MLGNGYVMDHCISVFLYETRAKADELKYQVYVTDCLRLLTETAARCVMSGSNVSYIGMRYADTLERFKAKKEPDCLGSQAPISMDIFYQFGSIRFSTACSSRLSRLALEAAK